MTARKENAMCIRCGERPKISGYKKLCEHCYGTCRLCGQPAIQEPTGYYRSLCVACRKAQGPRKTCSQCGQPRDGSHSSYCRACYRTYDRGRLYREKRRKDQVRPYGVVPSWFDAALARQGGTCAGCDATHARIVDGVPRGNLHIDHDHATGAVRGLLCNRCNNLLVRVNDDPAVLRRMAEYLEQHQQGEAA